MTDAAASADRTAVAEARLVVIDMQHVFADPASEWAAPGFGDALAGVQALLPLFAGRTVITRFVAPDRPFGAWVPYYERFAFARRPASDPLWDVVPELDVRRLPVVTAPTFGKWSPALAEATGHVRELVLAGVSTDCCVLSTALAAADAGVRVTVVADACAGASPADHARALAAMALYAPLIEITTVGRLLAAAPPVPPPPAP